MKNKKVTGKSTASNTGNQEITAMLLKSHDGKETITITGNDKSVKRAVHWLTEKKF